MNIDLRDIIVMRLFFTGALLIATYIFVQLANRAIDLLIIGVRKSVGSERVVVRTRTIRNLLKGLVAVVIYVISIIIILEKWGVNTAPILTGAGLIGLAFSFGSQSIIKDVISGVFIVLDDIYNVGDRVKIGSETGNVEKITLRMTILKDEKDNVVYIPNSQVNAVVRLSGGKK